MGEHAIIRNLYVMLAYAFDAVVLLDDSRFAVEDCDTVADLYAEVLAQGINARLRCGLHGDYVQVREELRTVRGRVDVGASANISVRTRAAVVCEYDEYSTDNLHNRVLKAALTALLSDEGVDVKRKRQLRVLLRYFAGVRDVHPRAIDWRTLAAGSYTRRGADYRLLHGVCRLVIEGLMQRDSAEGMRLAGLLPGERESALYERFLLKYFQRHHPHLAPAAPQVAWDVNDVAFGEWQLPAMRTDLVLKGAGRALIVDAKYYKRAMATSRFGKSTVHSAHLYQLLNYVRNYEAQHGGEVHGLLLYANTTERVKPHLDVSIHGHRIMARCLDLNLPWVQLRRELDGIAAGFAPAGLAHLAQAGGASEVRVRPVP